MAYDPEIHHRRSICLDGYDYGSRGAYFVTLCAQDRRCLFGEVNQDQLQLNEQGQLIDRVWREIPKNYAGVFIDSWVVMPNHLHGILWIGAKPEPDIVDGENCKIAERGDSEIGRTRGSAPTGVDLPTSVSTDGGFSGEGGVGRTRGSAPTSLSGLIQRFKSLTTKLYGGQVRAANWPPYDGRLWQRDYFEHVIRDNESLQSIRHYIAANPGRWTHDIENPNGDGSDNLERFVHSLRPPAQKQNQDFPHLDLLLDDNT